MPAVRRNRHEAQAQTRTIASTDFEGWRPLPGREIQVFDRPRGSLGGCTRECRPSSSHCTTNSSACSPGTGVEAPSLIRTTAPRPSAPDGYYSCRHQGRLAGSTSAWCAYRTFSGVNGRGGPPSMSCTYPRELFPCGWPNMTTCRLSGSEATESSEQLVRVGECLFDPRLSDAT